MSASLPIEFYQRLEESIGKEHATLAFAFTNEYLATIERSAQETVRLLTDTNKNAIREDLRKELASKADVELVSKELKGEIKSLDAKIDKTRIELEKNMDRLDAKIDKTRVELEAKIDRLDAKFNFVIALLIIALTLMNPVVAALLTKALKLG
jgi:DNA repair exonuclease SbcCD ATPase subunit